jgi:hypothetical protein
MATWIVRAMYPSGFGERRKPDGDEQVTRATMVSAMSCGTTSSTFAASVEADAEDEAVKEAMALIGRQAAYFSLTGEPVVSAAQRTASWSASST